MIRDILISQGSPEKTAAALHDRLLKEPLQRKERIAFMTFLIHCGFYKEALEVFSVWLKKRTPVSLRLFCLLLQRSGFKPGIDFLNPLFAAHTESPDHNLEHFQPWVTFDKRFTELRLKKERQLVELARERKEKLIEKLGYLRANRMIDEEERLLNELIFLYPDDPIFHIEKVSSRETWARAIIARRAYNVLNKDTTEVGPQLSPQELRLSQTIVAAMKDHLTRTPTLAYDFAIGLYFLDLFDQARDVLSHASPAHNVDWFQIELLLESRRYVECLDSVANLESRYAEDPETAFGATYYRALALRGLGQRGTATELLKSIVSIRPTYRSAHALLMKWTNA